MAENKVIGWLSLGLFILAVLVLAFLAVLIFFPTVQVSIPLNAQALMVLSASLGLLAAILGFFSRKTMPGRIGGVGGGVIFVILLIAISFTFITTVKTT